MTQLSGKTIEQTCKFIKWTKNDCQDFAKLLALFSGGSSVLYLCWRFTWYIRKCNCFRKRSTSKLVMFLLTINKRITFFRELFSNSMLIKIRILLKHIQNLTNFHKFNKSNKFNFYLKLVIDFYYPRAHYFCISWHSIASNFQCCIKKIYWRDNHRSNSADIKKGGWDMYHNLYLQKVHNTFVLSSAEQKFVEILYKRLGMNIECN